MMKILRRLLVCVMVLELCVSVSILPVLATDVAPDSTLATIFTNLTGGKEPENDQTEIPAASTKSEGEDASQNTTGGTTGSSAEDTTTGTSAEDTTEDTTEGTSESTAESTEEITDGTEVAQTFVLRRTAVFSSPRANTDVSHIKFDDELKKSEDVAKITSAKDILVSVTDEKYKDPNGNNDYGFYVKGQQLMYKGNDDAFAKVLEDDQPYLKVAITITDGDGNQTTYTAQLDPLNWGGQKHQAENGTPNFKITSLTLVPKPSEPDESKPDESKPDESKPDESKPDESKPDESKPDESKPDESKPDESSEPTTTTEPTPTNPTPTEPTDNNVVVVTDTPRMLMRARAATPAPTPAPANTEPAVVDDGDLDAELEIPDEEVPLAKAPVTGDISVLWLALSGLSGSGMLLLNRKRKEEE